jgi:hypothetical protein
MFPIREDVESCEEVETLELPEPLDDVIVGFLGGKYIDMFVTSEEESENHVLRLG